MSEMDDFDLGLLQYQRVGRTEYYLQGVSLQAKLLYELYKRGLIIRGNQELVIKRSVVEIAGDWTADDFGRLFTLIHATYRDIIEHCIRTHAYFLYLDGLGGDDNARYYAGLEFYRSIGVYDLRVEQVQYASPGSIDFVGLGAALGHIRDLILAYIPTKEQKLKNHEMYLDNINRTVSILREIGFSDAQIRQIVLSSEELYSALGKSQKLKANELQTPGVSVDINQERDE